MILKFFVRVSFLFERGKNSYSKQFTSIVRPKFDETKSEEKDQEERFYCSSLHMLYALLPLYLTYKQAIFQQQLL